MNLKFLFPFIFLLLFSFLSGAQQPAKVTIIKTGKFFDSQSGKFLSPQTILIEDNIIRQVGKDIPVPAGAEIIDLSSYTVLPGLIDAHTHLLYLESIINDPVWETVKPMVNEGDALRTLRASVRAKTFLETGFTSIKDLGNSGQFLDVALKRGIEEGTVIGPRMFISGPIISSVGGQFPDILKEESHLIDQEYRVVKGADDATVAVRENLVYGADLIKICANSTPNAGGLTMNEMKAIVETAHRFDRKVTAHATDNRSIWEAVMSGVDGIEHGYYVEDSTLKLMASRKVTLIPTDMDSALAERRMGFSKASSEKRIVYKQKRNLRSERLRKAVKFGVPIVAGSDNYLDFQMPQGEAAKHVLVSYYESGMSVPEILKSATINSSTYLGVPDKLGAIKVGAYADIIAVAGDVEKDFAKAIFDIRFVMKDGKVYVRK